MIEPIASHMTLAIELARSSRARGNSPIGAVVARGELILASATNTTREDYDSTAHAEINAIRLACQRLGVRYLEGCVLYTTFEPCPMCSSAAVWARMDGIVFGAAMADQTPIARQRVLIGASIVIAHGEPLLTVRGGFMRDECVALMQP